MGLFDVLRGRSSNPAPNLDNLFALPGAAITLQTALDFSPTGVGSVCYRAAEGAAFAATQRGIVELLETDAGPRVEETKDDFGFTWLVVRTDPASTSGTSGLVTDLHAVNTTLETQGFAPGLLCSLVWFNSRDDRRLGLIYLYKRGSFYPFAPTGSQQRDNLLELQVRDLLAADLPIESELSRWMPVWGAPGG